MMEKLRRGRESLGAAWRRLWDKVTAKIPRMPRPWRAARNLVCIVFGVYLIWLLLGGHPLTKGWAFRQAERQAMVGPSEILLERRENEDVTILGETQEGYFIGRFSRLSGGGWSTAATLYIQRQADVTLTVADVRPGIRYGSAYVDLLLLCDDPTVSRGEAEITLAGTGSLNGRRYDFDQTYTVEFLPVEDGILSGRVEARSEDDGSWESLLERTMLGDIYSNTVPVTIQLYNGAGALVLERSIQYRYPGF